MAYTGTSPLPESQGGTGSNTTFTVGSIIFAALNKYSQDNSNFFWDATNHRLGLGTAIPAYQYHQFQGNTTGFYIDSATVTKTTGYQSMYINQAAGGAGTKVIYCNVNANGNADTHGLNIDYTSGGILPSTRNHLIELNIDDTSALAGSSITGVSVLNAAAGAATKFAVSANPGVAPVLNRVGTYANSAQAWYYNGSTYTSITTGSHTIFSNQNDFVYVGSGSTFTQVAFNLSTKASAPGISAAFTYWNGLAWTSFSPADGTSGMVNSGVIAFGSLSGWALTTVNGISEFYIRIQRIAATLTTVPVESSIKIANTTDYYWDNTGLINVNSLQLVTPLAIASGGTNAATMATSTGIVKFDGTSLVTSSTAKIDASNRMTNSSQTLASYYVSPSVSNVTGDGTIYTILFNNATINQGSAYNTGTGIFTAPVTGNYLVTCGVGVGNLGAGHNDGIVSLITTAKNYQFLASNYGAERDANNNLVGSFSKIVPMTATDTLSVTVAVLNSTKTVSVIGPASPVTYLDVILLPG